MSMFSGLGRFGQMARLGLAALALLMLFSITVPAGAQTNADLNGDLGDAPDSSNHLSISLRAYPNHLLTSPLARYPSVFDPGLPGPQGPFHHNPLGRSWLGASASSERDADLLEDQDPVTNIWTNGAQRHANQDLLDDTLSAQGINLPRCARTSFEYTVSGAANLDEHRDYVNVWIDMNADGDWGDVVSCTTADGDKVEVSEWAVRNQPISVRPGQNSITTPLFGSAHTNKDERNLWLRITVAEDVLSEEHGDGSGPAGGFKTGETEDYFMTPASAAAASMRSASGADDAIIYEPDISYYTTY
jgi:hypothetical protein